MASSSKQNNEVEDNPILKNLENIKVSDPKEYQKSFFLTMNKLLSMKKFVFIFVLFCFCACGEDREAHYKVRELTYEAIEKELHLQGICEKLYDCNGSLYGEDLITWGAGIKNNVTYSFFIPKEIQVDYEKILKIYENAHRKTNVEITVNFYDAKHSEYRSGKAKIILSRTFK